ncbi:MULTISPECIES: acyltransferase family protein [unclassified Brevibacterium]|uniref:acyltransferase family protein n=1 Tax=unclassified Brevibacterium TaxID=2614124 RepID=UPI0010923B5B|nr:acyltransferase family protein [Brevibacterium sp. S22]TGD29400.1 acyltransferase [Brevibacterium sp. S22]
MPRSFLAQARKVDEATPDTRSREVDFLRAAAITVVVLGHWTIIAVSAGGGIDPHGLLDQARWTHPLTWVFQVMPIFFLVGGYSNALSWRSARRKNTGYAEWLRARLRRLGLPLIPLLLTWLATCVIALSAGAEPAAVQLASQMALVPTWFLAAYLLVVIVAPPCLILWEKWGWWSIIVGIVLAGIIDLISIVTDSRLAGYPNYLLVWASFHQFGYAWLDGRLTSLKRCLVLFVIGAVGLGLLVGFGPYPVSMITAGTDTISNSAPTRVTMAFLGMAQAGIVLMLQRPVARLLHSPGLWFLTVLVNQRIMTWFLWHLTALTALANVLIALDAEALLPTPLTGIWWLTRPLWALVLLAITGVLVFVFGRFESPAPDDRPAPPMWMPIAASAFICAGLAIMADTGMVDDGGVTWIWPLLPLIGMFVFGVVRLPGRRTMTS